MLKLFFDRDKIYPYPWYFAEESLTKDVQEILGKKADKMVVEIKKGRIYSYVDMDEINEIGEFLFKKIRSDKEFYKVVEKNVLKTGENLMSFCEGLKRLNLNELF